MGDAPTPPVVASSHVANPNRTSGSSHFEKAVHHFGHREEEQDPREDSISNPPHRHHNPQGGHTDKDVLAVLQHDPAIELPPPASTTTSTPHIHHEHKHSTMKIDASGSVAIVGCGVAGILTTLLMMDHCPNIRITVIDAFANGGRLTSFAPAAETLFQPPAVAFEQYGTIFGYSSLLRWRVLRWLVKRARADGIDRAEPFDRVEYGAKCRHEFKACLKRHPELEAWCKREGVLHLATQPGLNSDYQTWIASLKGKHEEKHYQYLDPEAARKLEPALEQEKFFGAILSTRDGYIQQERFLEAAIEICRARGVQFLFSRRVSGAKRIGSEGQIQLCVTPTTGLGGGYADARGMIHGPRDVPKACHEVLLFDKVVICAGVDTIRLGGLIGGQTLTGEIIPIKGYSITGRKKTLAVVPQRALVYREVDKFCRSLYDDPKTHEDDHMYRVGGGVILEGWPSPTVNFDQMRKLFQDTDLGKAIYNEGADRHVWAGLRPATPTNRPLVRSLANNRVFINSGHGFNGFVYPWYSTIECLELMWPDAKVQFKGASQNHIQAH